MPGLKVWTDGDTGTTASWTDQSTNGNNIISSGTNQPTITANAQNGHKAYLYDGVNDYSQALFSLTAPYLVHLTFKNVTEGALGSHDCVFDSPITNLAVLLSGLAYCQLVNGATLNADASAPIANNVYKYCSFIFNGASSSMRVNGSVIKTGTLSAVNPTGIILGSIGAANGGPGIRCTNVSILNVVVSQGNPAAGDLANLELYSKTRYAL